MKTYIVIVLVFVSILPGLAVAQHEHSPYAGEQARGIKALSPEEIEQYLAGAGMGFAKAAELNHYPGPKHVLGLAAELELTEDQAERTRRIQAEMSAEARRLGEALVNAEAELDARFAAGTIDEESLRAAVENIAALQARIRIAHLLAHIRLKQVLTPQQVHLYDQLRGYSGGASPDHSGHR